MAGNPRCLETVSGIPFEFLVHLLNVGPLGSCSTDVKPPSKFSTALDLFIIEGSHLGTSTGLVSRARAFRIVLCFTFMHCIVWNFEK